MKIEKYEYLLLNTKKAIVFVNNDFFYLLNNCGSHPLSIHKGENTLANHLFIFGKTAS